MMSTIPIKITDPRTGESRSLSVPTQDAMFVSGIVALLGRMNGLSVGYRKFADGRTDEVFPEPKDWLLRNLGDDLKAAGSCTIFGDAPDYATIMVTWPSETKA